MANQGDAMQLASTAEVARFRALVVGTMPQYIGAEFTLLASNPDHVVLGCDGAILRFGRTPRASARLRQEISVIAYLKPRVTMSLPQMQLVEGPEPFTLHRAIPGDRLDGETYRALDIGRRNAIALRLAGFLGELHVLPLPRLMSAGAMAVEPLTGPASLLAEALPYVPRKLQPYLRRSLKAMRNLRIEGDELVFGHFGTHGDNLAIDPQTGLLNGVFDFSRAGFGARHRDFAYLTLIDLDLAHRVIDRYEDLTGRRIQRDTVMLYGLALTLMQFLSAGNGVTPEAQRALADRLADLERLYPRPPAARRAPSALAA